MIDSRLGGTKPGRGVTAGQNILLDAERRNIKAVDYVLRGQDHLDVAAHGDVQFVDLALSFFMLQLPHPLLGYDVDFGSAAWRRPLREVNHRAPQEDHDENTQRNDRPGDFQRGRAFNLLRRDSPAPADIGSRTPQSRRRWPRSPCADKMTRKMKSASTLPAVVEARAGQSGKLSYIDQSSVFSRRSSALLFGSVRRVPSPATLTYLAACSLCPDPKRISTVMKIPSASTVASAESCSTREMIAPYLPVFGL